LKVTSSEKLYLCRETCSSSHHNAQKVEANIASYKFPCLLLQLDILFAVMLNMLAVKPSAPNVCLQINELQALKLGTDQYMSVCQMKPIHSGASECDQSQVII
jgi:hypothetical protein